MKDKAVVTGAFSYTGSYIARRLLEQGTEVVTLVRDPAAHRHPDIESVGYDQPPAEIMKAIEGASRFFNTYWVRYEAETTTFDSAVDRSIALIDLCRQASVGRFIHVSISNPSLDGPPYFRGKAMVEDALIASGLSYAIVRPTVIFGKEDVFINNLAWLLRRFPIFAVPGDGRYRLQPVHVEDVARICLEVAEENEDVIVDAAGPEIFTFIELLQVLIGATSTRCVLFPLPERMALALANIIGKALDDTVVTADELKGLRQGLIVSSSPPRGEISFSRWAHEAGDDLGRRYVSENARNYR